MRISLRFEEGTIRRLQEALHDREQRARHVTPALEQIADDFLVIQRRRFSGGAQWKPLSAEWAIRKAASGRPVTPLAGGNLERSLTRKGAQFSIRRINNGGAITLGTSDPVAHLHRDGTKKLPRRPPVSLSRNDEKRWVSIFERHLSPERRVGL